MASQKGTGFEALRIGDQNYLETTTVSAGVLQVQKYATQGSANVSAVPTGASAGDAAAFSETTIYVAGSVAGSGFILDGNSRVQYIYNSVASVTQLYPATGGTINATTGAYEMSAASGYIVNQLSSTLAFVVKGA